MANRLAQESSPYLQQHAHNPVDWYPWGSEALAKATREKKPIFLSIGYSACHWCHVMERESFEDAATAELLNRDFISIKVDREERPDLDHLYMTAVQAMTQHGGWPLNVFLTPKLEPFYGGTYFPPEDRQGMPSFKRILAGISQAWKSRADEVALNAAQIVQALKDMQAQPDRAAKHALQPELLTQAADAVVQSFDTRWGGLGNAPKFFHSLCFRLCLREWRRSQRDIYLKVVTYTLDHVARGGIHDQLAGGFHRYSTDAEWLVPHFEKMLYDNALLAELYLEAFQATRDPLYAQTARQTLDYLLREMQSPEGGFYSTQDADSEGVEGKFFVWSRAEVLETLGEELGTLFCRAYDVTEAGNWEGHNILRRVVPSAELAKESGHDAGWVDDQLAVSRRKLLQKRAGRVAPGRDEKILLSWNGMVLGALALGHQVLGDERYLEAAQKAATFLLQTFEAPQAFESGKKRFLHAHKDGKTRFNGYLDDYAFLLQGLLALFESDFNPRWLEEAQRLADTLVEQFWDPKDQTFYMTALDHEKLVARPREIQDGASAAGGNVAITALLRLARLTDRNDFEDTARAALQAAEPYLRLVPTGVAQLHLALFAALEPSREWVFFPGDDADTAAESLARLREAFVPNRLLVGPGNGRSSLTLLKGRQAQEGKDTLYVCEDRVCHTPLVGEAIQEELGKWMPASKS